jgi:hypothetical protein
VQPKKAKNQKAASTRARLKKYGTSPQVIGLFRLDVGRPDQLTPLLGFVGNELAEVRRRACERIATSWREAAAEYHRGQWGRLPVDIEPKRLARLRRLMADSVSLERAYYEIGRDNPMPAVTVQALMFSLRRGVNELTQPDTLRRLSALDGDQVKQVRRRVQAFQPEIAGPWSTKEVDALISAWRRSR